MPAGVREKREGGPVSARLAEMLLRKRDKFRLYLDILLQQGAAIKNAEPERLQILLDAERILGGEIRTLQKVIDPLADLHGASGEGEGSIHALEAELEEIAMEMKVRNAANRAALRVKMDAVKAEIEGLRALPPAGSTPAAVPSLIDLTV